MSVPSSIVDISTTAASNSPAGTDLIGNTLDDYLRSIQAIVKQTVSAGADITSSTTITPPASGYYFNVTGTTTITTIASTNSWDGRQIFLEFAGVLTFTHNASTLILPGSANITTAAGDVACLIQESSGSWRCIAYNRASGAAISGVTAGAITSSGLTMATSRLLGRTTASTGAVEEISVGSGLTLNSGVLDAVAPSSVPVRQTVLSGPVDSSGFSSFGGSTGSTTVTASGTLKATAAAGGDANYTGSITNPSWTGLSTNGTMYLYLDITSGGVVTTGSTTLAPVYQWGGTYSTTNLQNTFNIQEMTMKVGNGSTSSQVYRVFVGEVTVAGGVTTAITWYALLGRYQSDEFGLAVNTAYSKNHNIGVIPRNCTLFWICKTSEYNYAVGDMVTWDEFSAANYGSTIGPALSRRNNSILVSTGSIMPRVVDLTSPSGSSGNLLTAANWKFVIFAQRGW